MAAPNEGKYLISVKFIRIFFPKAAKNWEYELIFPHSVGVYFFYH
jgi:hypothetical protein